MWSLSAHKQFKRCARQWFFANSMANGKAKNDPERVEATRLAKLKTLAAWRGLVVDQVISAYLIPQVKNRQVPSLTQTLLVARSIFDTWYQMAKDAPASGRKLEVGLLDIETKGFVDPMELDEAWHEIETALTNLLLDEELLSELRSAAYLVDQRTLWYQVSNTAVKGIPDLMAFWHDRPPTIYDWKVHLHGTLSYEQQLLVYALALGRGKPQKDLGQYLQPYAAEDTQLTEVQLITHTTGHKRHYTVTATKLDETELFIADSLLRMYLADTNRSYAQSSADDYATADDPQVCFSCPFSKLCKQL